MKKQNKNHGIPFKLISIETSEFAIFEDVYHNNDIQEKEIETDLNGSFGSHEEIKNNIMCSIDFTFFVNKNPFMKIKVACFFEIEIESYKKLKVVDSYVYYPKDFLTHLIVLTLGTLRGVLHEKTENTKYNTYFIPIMDVSDLIKDDYIPIKI
jgi:hypothetical protein